MSLFDGDHGRGDRARDERARRRAALRAAASDTTRTHELRSDEREANPQRENNELLNTNSRDGHRDRTPPNTGTQSDATSPVFFVNPKSKKLWLSLRGNSEDEKQPPDNTNRHNTGCNSELHRRWHPSERAREARTKIATTPFECAQTLDIGNASSKPIAVGRCPTEATPVAHKVAEQSTTIHNAETNAVASALQAAKKASDSASEVANEMSTRMLDVKNAIARFTTPSSNSEEATGLTR